MASDPQSLLTAIVLIALGFLVVAAFYESLATRDVYVGRVMRLVQRRTERRRILALAYVGTVGIGIPVLIVVWAVVLATALVLVGSVDRAASAGAVAVAIVGAARVLAYARQKTAQDLSKAIPLALAFLLISGGSLNLEEKLARLRDAPDDGGLGLGAFALLIGLELALRITTDGAHALLAAVRRRRGSDSDLPIWRSLWAAVRRPFLRPAAGPGEAAR